MERRHTDRSYEEQLATLRQSLLLMAGQVEEMIASSTRALVERDPVLARQTIALDRKVNRAEVEIDELCVLLLVKRQPMASDLRFITQTFKMVTDLERIGDLAVNISERAQDLAALPPLEPNVDIPRMAELVQKMVRDAIGAFIDHDVGKADAVIACDDEVDLLYTKVFRDVYALMRDNPETMERGIHVQSVAKWLERMADHVTNIAEHVVFMVKGQDIRHTGKLGEAT